MAAIHDAIRAADEAGVKQVLQTQPKAANASDNKNQHPLVLAQRIDSIAIAKILVAHGARIDPQWIHDEDYPDALKAVAFWDALGIHIDTPSKWGGNMLLHTAIENDDIEMIERLVDLGADINAKGIAGRTPLRIALDYDYSRVVRRLVELGADVGLTLQEGETYDAIEQSGQELPDIGYTGGQRSFDADDEELDDLYSQGLDIQEWCDVPRKPQENEDY